MRALGCAERRAEHSLWLSQAQKIGIDCELARSSLHARRMRCPYELMLMVFRQAQGRTAGRPYLGMCDRKSIQVRVSS